MIQNICNWIKGLMFPDAPECTVLAVHHNEQKSSEIFKKSEYQKY